MLHTTVVNKAMTYHQTIVAKLDAKTVTLDTGGHFTATTKKRMTQFAEMFDLDFVVYQEKGEWFVQLLPFGSRQPLPFEGNTISFTI